MIKIDETVRARVSKVVDVKEKYTVVHLSTSRKVDGKYKYSDWGFTRLVGDAHNEGVGEGDVIVLKNAILTKEEYTDKDGETIKPKTPQMVVFGFDFYKRVAGKSSSPAEVPSQAQVPDEEDQIPF